MYAVIQIAGKQHRVKVGDQVTIDRQYVEEGKVVPVSDVLLIVGEDTKIGTPLVEKAIVELKVVKHQRGEKIRVATYRAKSRIRKVHGHRQEQTVMEVMAIRA